MIPIRRSGRACEIAVSRLYCIAKVRFLRVHRLLYPHSEFLIVSAARAPLLQIASMVNQLVVRAELQLHTACELPRPDDVMPDNRRRIAV